jgi:hypothetical protein
LAFAEIPHEQQRSGLQAGVNLLSTRYFDVESYISYLSRYQHAALISWHYETEDGTRYLGSVSLRAIEHVSDQHSTADRAIAPPVAGIGPCGEPAGVGNAVRAKDVRASLSLSRTASPISSWELRSRRTQPSERLERREAADLRADVECAGLLVHRDGSGEVLIGGPDRLEDGKGAPGCVGT